MAAGPALEMWSRQASSSSSNDGRSQSITVQRAFTVTLAANDPIETAYTAAGLPLVGNLYPGTSSVFCTSVSPQRTSPIMAVVTASYLGETSAIDVSVSPVDNTPSIEWGAVVTDEAIDQDWNGNAIVTANDEPIGGLTERLADDVVTIERNFLAVNRYALRAYRRATNSDTFLGWPPGTARIMDDKATGVFIGGVLAYWRVRAVIQFREPFQTTPAKAWYKRVRHEGFLVRDAAGEAPHRAWDLGTKSPVTQPVLLKADGTRETDSNAAHWLEFQTLGSLPFNALGLI